MLNRRTVLIATGLLVGAGTANAHDYKLGDLTIEHPWSRATAPSAPTAGGYLKIVNNGKTPDRLVSGRSAASEKVEIHEMKMEGNVMRMRELDKGLEIPAGGSVTLAPGGFHVMFIQLKEPFKEGAQVPVTLVFEKAGSIDVVFAVSAMGSGPKMSH
jgi:hypothetical protein